MSPQSQYVIGLYRDVNPTKNRCRYNIACPLGYGKNANEKCFCYSNESKFTNYEVRASLKNTPTLF